MRGYWRLRVCYSLRRPVRWLVSSCRHKQEEVRLVFIWCSSRRLSANMWWWYALWFKFESMQLYISSNLWSKLLCVRLRWKILFFCDRLTNLFFLILSTTFLNDRMIPFVIPNQISQMLVVRILEAQSALLPVQVNLLAFTNFLDLIERSMLYAHMDQQLQ